jgi:Holliday junction resolvasome RuvABC DNA-binding subunit
MKSNPAQHQLCLPFPDALAKRPVGLPPGTNEQLASRLDEIAELLEGQGANPFRVRAYRTAAETLRGLDRPVAEILQREGLDGLEQLPGVGRSLAHTIEQLVRTGRSARLERLRGLGVPEKLFATVPDIGPQLARQIRDQLGIQTLAELERAAHDGRLARVPGMGPKRVRAVRESLAGRFRRLDRTKAVNRRGPRDEPPVAELLDVDQQYRLLAELGRLPRIAPRRFNPTQEAWLPVLHTQRGGRHYTALYSNTARAHELGTLRDWVVIYRDDPGGHGQWTVVTGRYGRLENRRIVGGREAECASYYEQQAGRGRRPK